MHNDEATNVAETRIVLVSGPPGSGKTTYVQAHAMPGDVVVDLDLLHSAVSGGRPIYDIDMRLHPFAKAARDGVLRRLKQPSGARTAWIITSAATKSARHEALQGLIAHDVIVFKVEANECLNRIAKDERRKKSVDYSEIVHRWWNEYEPEDGLTVVSR